MCRLQNSSWPRSIPTTLSLRKCTFPGGRRVIQPKLTRTGQNCGRRGRSCSASLASTSTDRRRARARLLPIWSFCERLSVASSPFPRTRTVPKSSLTWRTWELMPRSFRLDSPKALRSLVQDAKGRKANTVVGDATARVGRNSIPTATTRRPTWQRKWGCLLFRQSAVHAARKPLVNRRDTSPKSSVPRTPRYRSQRMHGWPSEGFAMLRTGEN